MNKKKICIAIHSLAHAGAERVAATWANYLAKQGHDVFALVYACEKDAYDLDTCVRVVPIADTLEAYIQTPKIKRLWRIRRIIRHERPDILVSFLPKMQIIMMLATLGMRIKRIETVRNNPWIDRDVQGKRLLWNLCFYSSNAIVVQTKEQSLYFSKRLQKRIVVISNPVSSEFTKKQKVYSTAGIRRFVAVARISAQKNYPMMVQAFAKVARQNTDCTLDIYGAGSPETMQELQALINKLGMTKNIRMCGWRQDISEVLAAYDAFLMSSDYEGMPNALAEAMATGLVCLSTDCKTGPKDMIDSGINGYLATTGSVESFAERLQEIVQMDLQQSIAMGTAARERILDMCCEEKTLERLNNLIESKL